MNYVNRPLRKQSQSNKSQAERDMSRDQSWALKLVIVVSLAILVWMNIGFVKPLLLAGLFAAALYPFYLKLRSKIASDSLRAATLTLGFAILFLLPLCAVAFMAADAGLKKIKTLPEDWTGQIQIEPLLLRLEGFLPFERSDIVRVLEQVVTAVGRSALNLLQELVSDLPKLTIDNIVILIGIFVFLVNAPSILMWIRRFSPISDEKTGRLFKTIGSLSFSSVLATIASGIVQALLIGIFLLFMQQPGTLLIIMTAFVFSFLPVIGTAPVSLYLVATALIAGDWTRAVVFVVMAGVVGLSDNIVRPFVISDAAKLNGFIAFVAALGALETMGFYGLFLGPVVAGAVFTLVELVHEGQ